MNDRIKVTPAYEEPPEGFDSCIRQTGPGAVTVDLHVRQREGWRLELRIENQDTQPQLVELTVDWGAESVAAYSDLLCLQGPGETDWRQVPGVIRGSQTVTTLRLPPGASLLGICPLYAYRQCLDFIERLRALGDERIVIGRAGRSQEEREIPLFEIGGPEERPACLVVGRCHAYETAGNFNIEGMASFLLSDDDVARYLLERFRFHFIPMMNVDGVVHGLGRYTEEDGADLNRDFESNRNRRPGAEKDRALVSHFEVIDRLRPAAYLNIHNWMNKFDDGLIGWDPREVDTFESFMPALHGDHKRWKKSVTCVPGNRSPGRYSRETYGTVGFVLEFPWYGRTAERMRVLGVAALQALAHTALRLYKRP